MNHAAFELYYHLTLQVKYRHELINNDILIRMESIAILNENGTPRLV